MRHQTIRPARSFLVAGAIALLSAGAVAGAIAGGLGEGTARHAWDLLSPDGTADPRVVVVAIDEASLQSIGPWPWTKTQQAALLAAIEAEQPAAIGLDILSTGDGDEGSAALEGRLGSSTLVASRAFSSVTLTHQNVLQASGEVQTTLPADTLARAGHTVVIADSDGVSRTVPLVIQSPEGTFLPSLALATVARARGGDAEAPLVLRPNRVTLAGLSIPVEGARELRPHWAEGFIDGPNVVSAADVIAGAAEKDRLRGAIVFVGATAPALGDQHITPLQPRASTPGVIVQAEVADTIVGGLWSVPVPLPWSAGVVLVLGLLSAWAALRLRLRWAVATVVVCVLGYAAVGIGLASGYGLLADFVRVPAGILAAGVAAICARLLLEQRQRREIGELFSRYVPENVAEELLRADDPGALQGGRRLEVAVLFCDLRGFTPLAARLDPEQVRILLDRFYDFVCERVFARDGTIMQFVGDEVFAVFGAPLPQPDVRASARGAAQALVLDAAAFRARLVADGLAELHFGIGVHAGEVFAAHVGPRQRTQYAVVGDVVNVGSRLCGIAGVGEAVVSADAGGAALGAAGSAAGPAPGSEAGAAGSEAGPAAGAALLLAAESVTVKGKTAPIPVYRVTAASIPVTARTPAAPAH